VLVRFVRTASSSNTPRNAYSVHLWFNMYVRFHGIVYYRMVRTIVVYYSRNSRFLTYGNSRKDIIYYGRLNLHLWHSTVLHRYVYNTACFSISKTYLVAFSVRWCKTKNLECQHRELSYIELVSQSSSYVMDSVMLLWTSNLEIWDTLQPKHTWIRIPHLACGRPCHRNWHILKSHWY
jgi:hypothetical protein